MGPGIRTGRGQSTSGRGNEERETQEGLNDVYARRDFWVGDVDRWLLLGDSNRNPVVLILTIGFLLQLINRDATNAAHLAGSDFNHQVLPPNME